MRQRCYLNYALLQLGTLEEQNQLREENKNLKKKLEQLQIDRCEDVEELVYLKWINACLRYELRNYQPPPGRTVARDLSSYLSPKSEQKAKQLILDYSNSPLNSNRLMDFDLDDYFSQTSSEEFDDNSLDSSKTKSSKSSKSKLVNKLKKLVLPKSRNEDKMVIRSGSDLNYERRASSSSTCAIDDCRRKSFGSASGFSLEKTNNSIGVELHGNNSTPCSSLDVNCGMPERCRSDLGVVYAHKRMISLDDNSTYNSCAKYEETEDHEKEKLKKFAQVFKDSLGSLKSKRLQSSLSIG